MWPPWEPLQGMTPAEFSVSQFSVCESWERLTVVGSTDGGATPDVTSHRMAGMLKDGR